MGAADPSTSASCGEGFSGACAIFRKALLVFFFFFFFVGIVYFSISVAIFRIVCSFADRAFLEERIRSVTAVYRDIVRWTVKFGSLTLGLGNGREDVLAAVTA